MNTHCDQCGAPDGGKVIRSSEDASRVLILGSDLFFYMPDGTRLRQSQVPEEFDDSKPMKVELSIVMMDARGAVCVASAPSISRSRMFSRPISFIYYRM